VRGIIAVPDGPPLGQLRGPRPRAAAAAEHAAPHGVQLGVHVVALQRLKLALQRVAGPQLRERRECGSGPCPAPAASSAFVTAQHILLAAPHRWTATPMRPCRNHTTGQQALYVTPAHVPARQRVRLTPCRAGASARPCAAGQPAPAPAQPGRAPAAWPPPRSPARPPSPPCARTR